MTLEDVFKNHHVPKIGFMTCQIAECLAKDQSIPVNPKIYRAAYRLIRDAKNRGVITFFERRKRSVRYEFKSERRK